KGTMRPHVDHDADYKDQQLDGQRSDHRIPESQTKTRGSRRRERHIRPMHDDVEKPVAETDTKVSKEHARAIGRLERDSSFARALSFPRPSRGPRASASCRRGPTE